MALKPRRNECTEPQATEAPGGEERAAGTGRNSALDEEIRRRAYQLYVERGGQHGRVSSILRPGPLRYSNLAHPDVDILPCPGLRVQF
jgi:Protein of unknown function (DUF2934)